MTSKMSLVVAIVASPTIPYYEEIIRIKDKVQELIDYAVKFDTMNACEEFVRSVRYEHIVLIVTPDMINEIFVQNIHQIRHVQSIFLFDPNVTMDSHCVYELRRLSYKVRIKLILITLEE
jgi:hypothetical protein